MTLSEWLEQNKNKEIEFNDGKIKFVNDCPFKHGDEYYYIDMEGIPFMDSWDDTPMDYRRWNQGTAFKTREEAKRALALVKETLLKFREENK